VATPAKKAATYEDLFSLPEHVVGEIVGGELHVSPRPAARHTRAASVLGIGLGGPFDRGRDGPGGWIILDEPELHLGKDILVPDLAGWRRERMPSIPDVAFFTLAPDWVCEVLSPSTASFDRKEKLPVYAREKVSHVWLVDPAVKLLEVYKLLDGRWTLLSTHANADRVRAEPFDAVELELGSLWE
jgi:Uma2 family endonuclease